MKYIHSIISLFIIIIILCSCANEDSNKTAMLHPLVKISKVMVKDFEHKITVQGSVEADQNILLNAESSGLITNIAVKNGQHVHAGQTIARIDAAIINAGIEEIKAQIEYADYNLEKIKQLFEKKAASEFELKGAETQLKGLKTKLNTMQVQRGKNIIAAPFSGIIDEVFAQKGQTIMPQSPIVRLINKSSVEVVAAISEKYLSKVKVGSTFSVSLPNYNDTLIYLKVSSVGNYIEPTNRTFKITSVVNNNKVLLPNMLTQLNIVDLFMKNGTVIPSQAILKDEKNEAYIFITQSKKKQFKAQKVNVKVIESYNGETLITPEAPIKGASVITEGGRGIATNDIVRIK